MLTSCTKQYFSNYKLIDNHPKKTSTNFPGSPDPNLRNRFRENTAVVVEKEEEKMDLDSVLDTAIQQLCDLT